MRKQFFMAFNKQAAKLLSAFLAAHLLALAAGGFAWYVAGFLAGLIVFVAALIGLPLIVQYMYLNRKKGEEEGESS